MTTTNMFLNFGGKWDSPPLVCEGFHSGVERRVVITKREVKMVWC